MFVAVVGGNLQGVEATYLALKAGWKVMVIDKKPAVPASGLCDFFVQLDVTAVEELGSTLKGIDLVIPALENYDALYALSQWTKTNSVPFAFDLEAYLISSSKVKSDKLFARIGVPTPKPWPESGFPVIAKPSEGSGSQGILIINDLDEMKRRFHVSVPSEKWVVQEFVQGPTYSLEVIGFPEQYRVLYVTDLAMDAYYDCKRVIAPTELSTELIKEFENMSVVMADALKLHGLMDIEVILNDGVMKVLEIDARLPSQTPTAVYWSTGLNMVQLLGEHFLYGHQRRRDTQVAPRGVVYEHIKVSSDVLAIAGEHIMSGVNGLYLSKDFFGADETITNYTPDREEWVATLIISGADRQKAWAKRCGVIDKIRKRFGLSLYSDPVPV